MAPSLGLWILYGVGCIVLMTSIVTVAAKDPQCNQQCFTNNDCLPSLECSHCYHGACQPGLKCGATCQDTTDCNQESNCTMCTNNVCSSGCGQPCNTTGECVSYGCSDCVNNVCVLLKCGTVCRKDQDCASTTNMCGLCDVLAVNESGFCRSPCGTTCVNANDCPERCPFCTNSKCGVFMNENE